MVGRCEPYSRTLTFNALPTLSKMFAYILNPDTRETLTLPIMLITSSGLRCSVIEL